MTPTPTVTGLAPGVSIEVCYEGPTSQLALTAVAVPLAMPFLAFWPLSSLMQLLSSTSMPGWLFGIVAYRLLSVWFLSEKYFPPLHYLPGHFEDPIVSPDGCWVAFTARHVYGPEDLLVISKGGSADD